MRRVRVGDELLERLVLRRELGEHAVGLAQRRAGAADDVVDVLGAARDAGAELVEDDPQALAVRAPQHVVDEVDGDRRRRLLDRDRRAVRELLGGGAGLAVDVVLADQRLRARLAGDVLAQRAEARLA